MLFKTHDLNYNKCEKAGARENKMERKRKG